MANLDAVLAHVEQIEYLREMARQQAMRIVDGSDVQQLLDDPAAYVQLVLTAIVALVGPMSDEVHAIAVQFAADIGMAVLNDARASSSSIDMRHGLFFAAMAGTFFAAASRVQSHALNLLSSGVDSTFIATAMLRSATQRSLLSGVRSLARNAADSLLIDVQDDVQRRAIDAHVSASVGAVELVWVTMEDANVCSDVFENSCEPRHGIELTRAQWRQRGEPRSSILICSHRRAQCRCWFDTVESARSTPLLGPVDISQSVDFGRMRARDELGIPRRR